MSVAGDQIAGALLGVHVGDSLGATLEFMSWSDVRAAHPNGHRDIVGGGAFHWKPGSATDDTDLTRAVVLGYREHFTTGADVTKCCAEWMLRWQGGDWPGRRKGSFPNDIGRATAVGLRSYQHHGDPTRSGAGQGSAGNGSLMRCVATGVVRSETSLRRRESASISAITHDDERCIAACIVYNDMVSMLVDGATASAALAAGEASARAVGDYVLQAFERGRALDIAHMARTGDNPLPDGGRGFVLDSFSIAVAALADEREFEDVIVDVVSLGGDTDTNGAIAGGLRGALDGASAIPSRWVEKLQFADEFREFAEAIERWRH